MRLAATSLMLLLAGCATTPSDIPKNAEPDLKQAAKINAQMGLDYMRKGDLKLAEEKLKRAIAEDSRLTTAHAGLGILYSRRGRDEEAEASFRQAVSLEPDNPDSLNNYGIFLCGKGKADEAEKLFLKAAKNPDNPHQEVAWTNAGACIRSKEPDTTETYLREALKANPKFPDALAQFASLSYERGDYLRARAFLQRYEAVGALSPNTLWLRAKTEAALGDATTARMYEQLLKTKFPEAHFADPRSKPSPKK